MKNENRNENKEKLSLSFMNLTLFQCKSHFILIINQLKNQTLHFSLIPWSFKQQPPVPNNPK